MALEQFLQGIAGGYGQHVQEKSQKRQADTDVSRQLKYMRDLGMLQLQQENLAKQMEFESNLEKFKQIYGNRTTEQGLPMAQIAAMGGQPTMPPTAMERAGQSADIKHTQAQTAETWRAANAPYPTDWPPYGVTPEQRNKEMEWDRDSQRIEKLYEIIATQGEGQYADPVTGKLRPIEATQEAINAKKELDILLKKYGYGIEDLFSTTKPRSSIQELAYQATSGNESAAQLLNDIRSTGGGLLKNMRINDPNQRFLELQNQGMTPDDAYEILRKEFPGQF